MIREGLTASEARPRAPGRLMRAIRSDGDAPSGYFPSTPSEYQQPMLVDAAAQLPPFAFHAAPLTQPAAPPPLRLVLAPRLPGRRSTSCAGCACATSTSTATPDRHARRQRRRRRRRPDRLRRPLQPPLPDPPHAARRRLRRLRLPLDRGRQHVGLQLPPRDRRDPLVPARLRPRGRRQHHREPVRVRQRHDDPRRLPPLPGPHDHRKGMAYINGTLVKAFTRSGWGWGGTWPLPTDYQHFSANGT